MSGPSVLSLFAGIGGIDLGLEALGCHTIAYSEIDPYACKIMALRFPDAASLGDITTIDWDTIERPDIICGGFPCQDISLAGRGAGIAGERSGLWRCYADAIRHLRPRGVLVENVAALSSRGLDRVLWDLASCGYDAEWDCIPAAAVGAPHRRDRLFIISYGAHASRDDFHADRQRFQELNISTKPSNPEFDHRDAVKRKVATNAPHERRSWRVNQEAWNQPWPAPWSLAIANSNCVGQSGSGEHEPPQCAAEGKAWQASGAGPTGWWRVEPDVGRVAHGIPNQMDRLKCLGNAVVPQVAEHVGRILFDRMELCPTAPIALSVPNHNRGE